MASSQRWSFSLFTASLKEKYVTVCDELFICPQCGMGDRCAMKFGPRIGKLCDCGRGANCNSYLLKCIWGAFLSFFTITASLLQDSRHPSWRLSSFHRLSQTDATPPISLFISVMHRCLRMSMGFFCISDHLLLLHVNVSCSIKTFINLYLSWFSLRVHYLFIGASSSMLLIFLLSFRDDTRSLQLLIHTNKSWCQHTLPSVRWNFILPSCRLSVSSFIIMASNKMIHKTTKRYDILTHTPNK